MRILHIVTLFTPDGAFGGPSRVALNQCAELTSRGHEVTVAAAYHGYSTPPTHLDGVPLQLFPARRVVPAFGYSAISARGMGRWLWKNRTAFDVAHIHLGRDLVSTPAAIQIRRQGVPLVMQTHGMLANGDRLLAKTYDRLLTRKLLQDAACTLYLNDIEHSDLLRISPTNLVTQHLFNGLPAVPQISRVATAGQPEVLFFGRLHFRKQPVLFAQAALCLLRAGENASFAIVGPPEGEEAAVDDVIRHARAEGYSPAQIRREPGVSLRDAYKRMAQASIYVLPSKREPFGMTIVEALSLGIPVITPNDGGLAKFIEAHECGLLIDDSLEALTLAIKRLLSDPTMADEMGSKGARAVAAEFSIDKVAETLELIYNRAVARRRHGL